MAATHFELSIGGNPINMFDTVDINPDGVEDITVDFQMKDGESDDNGAGETVLIEPKGALVPLDKVSFTVDGNGQGSFTFGPFGALIALGPKWYGEIQMLVRIDQFYYITFFIRVVD